MKKIGVDFDDVLYELNPAYIAFHNDRYGTNMRFEDIHRFEMDIVWGIHNDEVIRRLNEFFDSDLHSMTKPVYGSIETVSRLSKNFELHLITSRKEELRERTVAWINKHFPSLFKEFHFTNIFDGTQKKRSKSKVCKELGIEIMIDDAMHYARDLAQNGIEVLLLNKPWNQGEVTPPIKRVYSWKEVEEILNLQG